MKSLEFEIEEIRYAKAEIEKAFAEQEAIGDGQFPNIGEGYVSLGESAYKLLDWAERAADFIAGKHCCDGSWAESCEGCELINELKGK